MPQPKKNPFIVTAPFYRNYMATFGYFFHRDNLKYSGV